MSASMQKSLSSKKVKEKKDRSVRDKEGGGSEVSLVYEFTNFYSNMKLLSQLVKLKDDQIKKMIERISSLHTYNGQFSIENEDLKRENLLLRQSVATMKRKFEEERTKACPKCESMQSQTQVLQSQSQVLTMENTDLKNDIEMLKILVYR